MRYRANAKVLDKRGRELGRVTYTVKAKNRTEAKGKLSRLMKARKHKAKAKTKKKKNARRRRR
jgi:hypothetical protein